MHSANWLIKQGSGKMTVDGKSAGNGGMQTWSLKFFESEAKLPTTLEEAEAAPTTSSGNEGYWYLVRNRVDDTNVPPEGGEQVNVGTSTGQALSWDAEIEDLRMRLGEVRYGAQDGAWAKANFSRTAPTAPDVTASGRRRAPFTWAWTTWSRRTSIPPGSWVERSAMQTPTRKGSSTPTAARATWISTP